MIALPPIIDFARLRALYAGGATPLDMVEALLARLTAADPAIFIAMTAADALRRQAAALADRAPGSLPLWGLPVAVKDNIDVVGLPTTAGCPAYAYAPSRDATAVRRLREAGAIVIGKTNLDQFATGLNGTRSPYGAPRCVFNPDYVSGGSSSGSGVAVAAGLAAFALGTDTAGSGRVPAAFNNIVGMKPSPGRVPITGVVPACRSVDVVTIFAASVADAAEVRRVMEGIDPADPFSRTAAERPLPDTPTLGIPSPEACVFHGNAAYRALFDAAAARAEGLGAEVVEIDFRPFAEAARLLYEGPWVAERLHALTPFIDRHGDAMDPSVRTIVEGARGISAVDVFDGLYRLEAFRRETDATWARVDALLLPTAPTIHSVAAIQADPLAMNAELGHYTNFANLFGCAAIALPAGFTKAGLPFGVQLVAPRDADAGLAPFAARLHDAAGTGAGLDRALVPPVVRGTGEARIALAVVGAHLSGMALNHELTDLGARLVERTRTAPVYRLYALAGDGPERPGLMRQETGGGSVEIEIWSFEPAAFGRFVAAIPTPLGIGRVALETGGSVSGFLCEGAAVTGAVDITGFGGWRAWLETR